MSMHQSLDDAICLLALVTQRPPGLEESVEKTEAKDIDEESQSKSDEKLDDPEDPAVLGSDPEREQYRIELKNQFLDRLAETLARFKNDAQARNSNDAKHVSAAMMVCYEDEEHVKIFCAKNEGLDKEDNDFLARWKLQYASNEDTFAMFNLVAEHQWPRITTYLESLKRVFQSNINLGSVKSMLKPFLVEELVLTIPSLQSREWEDDSGFLYTIPLGFSERAGRPVPAEDLDNMKSNTTCTGETICEIQGSVSELFEEIHRLCQPDTTPEDQKNLLKEIMSRMFELWRESRARFMLKAALRRQFTRQEDKYTLLFLARVCYAAYIYVEVAKVSRSFRSIDIVSVSHSGNQGQRKSRRRHKKKRRSTADDECATILDVIKTLGLAFHPSWRIYLAQNAAKFTNMRNSKRDKDFYHAESQLLAYFEYSMSPDDRNQSHKYIGCSRRCCWLCHVLVRAHEHFGVRGTHETLLYRWNVPTPSLTEKRSSSAQLDLAMERLLMEVMFLLQDLLSRPKEKRLQLKAQSSHALSSTGAIWQQKPVYHNSSHRDFQRMVMMPTVFNNGLLITPIYGRPGYATVSGARFNHRAIEMTFTEAERLKDEDIRSMFKLEPPHKMPLRRISRSHKCKACGQPSESRCAACRMNYCSRRCQSKDWFRHVFVCCVKSRPNDADYLKLLTRQWVAVMDDLVPRTRFLATLFEDDHLCKAFGFNICVQEMDIVHLFCIYNNLTSRFPSRMLQHFVDYYSLGRFIEHWIKYQMAQNNMQDCGCFPWFLSLHQSGALDIPDRGGEYLYQLWAIQELDKMFPVYNDSVLSRPEHVVRFLYRILLRDINNIPKVGDPEWVRFGFCYCTKRAQMQLLAKAYIQLATHASLNQIATAWMSDSLLGLMETKGISMSSLVSEGIYPRQPSPETIGIYRLMSEVAHGLGGCPSCACKNARCGFHSKDEPLLCKESEADYGFLSVNTWERWRLLNFYSNLFADPKFNPQKMQEAKRDPDPQVLETYIESVVPGFRRVIWNEHLTDGMFPKLGTRLKFRGPHPSCECFIHNLPLSEGVDHNVNVEIDWICEQYRERNREKASDP
ncbi:uncharacterized protein N7500_009165 [Penicillium coprophilum]|uniref:uncharacterized protein n=1 Tax=Penicillium coprophilum TaxID=36646 RepID=UPI002389FF87|nr:uncharacterized protein N7500_009165 [Penicillium coprophilum]KAJ5153726.1 hypothetical protein N7500_009165 [Penicillium coprophilum]